MIVNHIIPQKVKYIHPFAFMNKWDNLDKEIVVIMIMNRYNVGEDIALEAYRKWRKEYMKVKVS